MNNDDKASLLQLLGRVMAGYGKPLPDGPVVSAWLAELAPFAPVVIAAAFAAYRTERPDHAPVPNSIATRCRLLDGRPEENEAWAMAVTSQDERATVVWTDEMRDAFHQCKPLLDLGDEVAARMAFKEAYSRMVAAARASNHPAHWNVSEGWDGELRQKVITRAAAAGLLPAPPSHLMIESNLPPERPEGLKRVLEAVGKLEDPLEKARRLNDERVEAEYHAEQDYKRTVHDQVRQYVNQKNGAAQ